MFELLLFNAKYIYGHTPKILLFHIYNVRRNNRNKFRRKKVNFETHIIIIIKFHQIPKEQFPMPLSNSQMYNLTYIRYRIDSHEEHT